MAESQFGHVYLEAAVLCGESVVEKADVPAMGL